MPIKTKPEHILPDGCFSPKHALQTCTIPKVNYQKAKKLVLNHLERKDKGSLNLEFNAQSAWLKVLLTDCGFLLLPGCGPIAALFLDKMVEEGCLSSRVVENKMDTILHPKQERRYFLAKMRTKFVSTVQEERTKPFERLNQLEFPSIPIPFVCVNCDSMVSGHKGEVVRCPVCGISFVAKQMAE